MKALTIRQPWASLIALGAKRIETRSWATSYRGPIAIHASAKFHREDMVLALTNPAMRPWLERVGVLNLPTGAVIAKTYLIDCIPTGTPEMEDIFWGCEPGEHAFGDYRVGRYGWVLGIAKPIDPVPAKGQLGLWNWSES